MKQLVDYRVRVDPTNPGQFFACCGLLEIAYRLWGGAEGWFEPLTDNFRLRSIHEGIFSEYSILDGLSRCNLTNTMTSAENKRLEELTVMSKKEREANETFITEKKRLDELRRESPVLLHEPISLYLDWFVDDRADGKNFKTWAGQQSVLDITRGMKTSIKSSNVTSIPSDNWLSYSSTGDELPFYFDSDLGNTGSDLDVGFSLDPLGIRMRTRPVIELAAFVGLQRFRPARIAQENRFQYSLWFDPLAPEVAAAAACGIFKTSESLTFEFSLKYRTKYLKSFLPANQIERREQ